MRTNDFIHPEDAVALRALKSIPWLIRIIMVSFFLLCLFPSMGKAQIEKWDSLTNLAKSYFQHKDYIRSIECYEQVITLVSPYDKDGKLVNNIRGTIALNYIYLGVPLLKAKKYSESKPYFEKALEYSAKDLNVRSIANSWMGNWYSLQALSIRSSGANLQQSIDYSIMAEKYYKIAKTPEKYLKERISRATVLSDISQIDDARHLLQQVIAESVGNDQRASLHAKALNELGSIEQNAENYQLAIQYLERSYNLSIPLDRQNARSAATRLQRLYETQIPDSSKAELWKKRADRLNDKKEE